MSDLTRFIPKKPPAPPSWWQVHPGTPSQARPKNHPLSLNVLITFLIAFPIAFLITFLVIFHIRTDVRVGAGRGRSGAIYRPVSRLKPKEKQPFSGRFLPDF
jgi:hypothetical protein